jgi:hypothetical protein
VYQDRNAHHARNSESFKFGARDGETRLNATAKGDYTAAFSNFQQCLNAREWTPEVGPPVAQCFCVGQHRFSRRDTEQTASMRDAIRAPRRVFASAAGTGCCETGFPATEEMFRASLTRFIPGRDPLISVGARASANRELTYRAPVYAGPRSASASEALYERRSVREARHGPSSEGGGSKAACI